MDDRAYGSGDRTYYQRIPYRIDQHVLHIRFAAPEILKNNDCNYIEKRYDDRNEHRNDRKPGIAEYALNDHNTHEDKVAPVNSLYHCASCRVAALYPHYNSPRYCNGDSYECKREDYKPEINSRSKISLEYIIEHQHRIEECEENFVKALVLSIGHHSCPLDHYAYENIYKHRQYCIYADLYIPHNTLSDIRRPVPECII